MSSAGLFAPETDVQLVLGEDWSPPVYAEPPDEFWAALDSDDGLVYVEGSSSGSGEIAVPKVAALPEQIPVAYGISFGWAMYAIGLRAIAKCVGGDGVPTESGGVFFWRFDTGMPNSV